MARTILRAFAAVIGFLALALAALAGAILWVCLRYITGEAPDIFPIIRRSATTTPEQRSEPEPPSLPTVGAHRARARGAGLSTQAGGRTMLGRSIAMEDVDLYADEEPF